MRVKVWPYKDYRKGNDKMKLAMARMRAALVACCAIVGAAALAENDINNILTAASPKGVCKLTFSLDDGGRPTYALDFRGQTVIMRSRMGLDLKGHRERGLKDGFTVVGSKKSSFNETWKPVWGEESVIRDNHVELFVKLEQKDTGRFMNIRFRVFDDGLGFRYEFPEQKRLGCFTIAEERTDFTIPCNAKAWWIPEDYYTQEYNYIVSRLNEIPELFKKHGGMNRGSVSNANYPGSAGVQTAVQLKYDNGLYVNIHEADRKSVV